ncbi:MAG: hypothetical protein KJ622_09485 [Alphaproteobacteria bacterium]|nr:hypothetical protein [Alphaproteobacteria bacterium]
MRLFADPVIALIRGEPRTWVRGSTTQKSRKAAAIIEFTSPMSMNGCSWPSGA